MEQPGTEQDRPCGGGPATTARRRRVVRVLFTAGWVGVLSAALRTGATAFDVNPEQLMGLLAAGYLAAWGLVFFLAARGPEWSATRFVACTFAVLAALVIIEAPTLLGAVDYRSVFKTPTPPWRRPGYRPDPELIYARTGPRRMRETFGGAELHQLRGAAPWQTYRCDVELDRNGFRNPVDLRQADVVLVGDSFVEGLHVADGALVTARLASALGTTVANLGRSGYGPQQELHLLRRYGLPLRPGTLVWAFYEGNDLQDVNAYDSYQRDLRWIVRGDAQAGFYSRCFTRNALVFAIRTWLRPPPKRPAEQYCGRFARGSGTPVTMYFATGVQHGDGGPALPRSGAPELGRVRDVLAQAHALCRSEGIDLVVVFVPAKYRVYRDQCVFDRAAACRDWPLDDLPGAVGTAVASISDTIGYVDLTPRFCALASSGALLYLPDDPHWTADGHRAAAAALADYLRARRPATAAR
jgi:hypothetical protein